mgnify:CR=1 FL=1
MNTIAPPDTIPARAPWKVVLLQNSEQITRGPNAAPNPAHAKDTIPNIELFGSRAMITPRTDTTTTVSLAAIMLAFGERFRWKVSCKIFCDTLEDAARSCESAVDIVLARIPMGGVFGIYELLPAFLVGIIVIIVVSLLTPAPSQEILDEFDHVKSDKQIEA